MTDSPRPADLVTEAELLARFWSAELIRDVLGKYDWPASSPLLLMTAALAKGKSVGLPGWNAARVVAAEERNPRVQKERALQHYWQVPPADTISREELVERGWSQYAIATLLGGKDWPPVEWRGYRHQRPEVYFSIARVAKIEAQPDFPEQLRKLNGMVVGAR